MSVTKFHLRSIEVDQLIAQAVQAHTYFDGTTHYEIDNCYEDADDNGNPCFRILDPRTSEDYLIAFCDIPAEAYFMKLVRI